jgi:PEP-CTERM motif
MLRRMTIRLGSTVLAAAMVAAGSLIYADTLITNFTPGDLVVLRTGDAANPDGSTNTNQSAVYLDEYSTGGSYVGTMDVPSTGSNALTIPGVGDFQHQGLLHLSTNGNLLTFAGYQAAAGSADANAQSGAVQPVIGVVGNASSSLTTNTVVNSYGPGSANPYIRGAYTNDGNEFWTFGKFPASNATSNGGLAYVSGTGPTATTTTVEGFADWRDVIAVNGQLYGGTGSSSVGNHGPYQISTGEPTTNLGNALSNNTQLGNYPGGQSASALALLNLPGDPNSQNGLNVLYTIGDQSTPGIVKYYYNGTTWVNQTNVALNALNNVVNPTGLIAVQDPTNPNWVDLTVSGTNGIYTYVDQSGYNGVIPANAFTDLVSVPDNEQFRGIAFAPVPEPSTLVLAAISTLGLLGGLRCRKQA